MTWHIEVDQGRCLGSGVCVGTAPELFVLEEDRARPRNAEVQPDEEVLDVADSCPLMAIEVREGAEVIAPRP
ncbi:ferredoxin [Streptomyces zingiberis]|nr:ferredoxin [Streptomyces zingiberis]